jgi:hypothetical protein
MTQSFKKSADLLAILSEEAEILEVTLLDLLLQVVDCHTEMQQRKNDLYRPVCNAFDEGKSITRAMGEGWALENRDFLSPVKWHRAVNQDARIKSITYRAISIRSR